MECMLAGIEFYHVTSQISECSSPLVKLIPLIEVVRDIQVRLSLKIRDKSSSAIAT